MGEEVSSGDDRSSAHVSTTARPTWEGMQQRTHLSKHACPVLQGHHHMHTGGYTQFSVASGGMLYSSWLLSDYRTLESCTERFFMMSSQINYEFTTFSNFVFYNVHTYTHLFTENTIICKASSLTMQYSHLNHGKAMHHKCYWPLCISTYTQLLLPATHNNTTQVYV